MITIITPCFKTYPILLHSLLMQTYTDWECLMIHDGPNEALQAAVGGLDPRITFTCSAQRYNDFGHSLRQIGLDATKSKYVLITNHDNYYVPTALEQMVRAIESGDNVCCLCDMAHNYYGYKYVECELVLGLIDIGCCLWLGSAIRSVGWVGRRMQSDWDTIQACIERYGSNRFVRLPKCCFVHN